MYTLEEVKERLLFMYDVESLVELLSITADDIVERFEDKVASKLPDYEHLLFEEDCEDEY